MVKEEVKVTIKRVESGRERKTEGFFKARTHLIAVRSGHSGHNFGCATQIGYRSRRPLRETETLRFLANSNLTRRELRFSTLQKSSWSLLRTGPCPSSYSKMVVSFDPINGLMMNR